MFQRRCSAIPFGDFKWITSYVAGDKVYRVHDAEDAETIYRHERYGGIFADLVTEVSSMIAPVRFLRGGHQVSAASAKAGDSVAGQRQI